MIYFQYLHLTKQVGVDFDEYRRALSPWLAWERGGKKTEILRNLSIRCRLPRSGSGHSTMAYTFVAGKFLGMPS
jgi:hypothetical protein